MSNKYLNASIGLSNPKSPENVGSVMRAAGNYRVDSVFYTGQRYERALKLNPDVPNVRRKVSENVCITSVESLIDDVPKDLKIVCVEFAMDAVALPQFQHPEKACYIFGPEDGNISQDIIDRADAVVYVPTIGSMNLAASVNVVLYDRLAKITKDIGDNELIRQNRDTNNNLKVRK
jgi:tRNA(Leu) C34 or U34 (ribose-2'-O)-methylase TrmL